jgi:hypothetical protein
MQALRHKRDFYAGGLMMLFGLFMALNGPSYRLGTLMHMGPGFMPTVLARRDPDVSGRPHRCDRNRITGYGRRTHSARASAMVVMCVLLIAAQIYVRLRPRVRRLAAE